MNVQVVHVLREGGKGRMSSLIHMLATDLSVLDSRIELRKCCSLMLEVLCLCEMSVHLNHPSGPRQNGNKSTSTRSNKKHRNSSCDQGCSDENHSNSSIQRLAPYHPSGKNTNHWFAYPKNVSPPAVKQETLIRLVKRCGGRRPFPISRHAGSASFPLCQCAEINQLRSRYGPYPWQSPPPTGCEPYSRDSWMITISECHRLLDIKAAWSRCKSKLTKVSGCNDLIFSGA